MYCRTCGNNLNENAEICPKCGVKKFVGYDYCQVCGGKTAAGMQTCKKCGARLRTALSSRQMKKKAVSSGKKIGGTALIVIGVIFLMGAVGNYITIFMGSHGGFTGGGLCLALGLVSLIFGIRIRKSA